ncbi:hypothetical protein ACIOWF_05175 [Cellulosimicrobium cellulans]|uniref:hypothetical protein n=1 Tax=Cellulosimicrobium cellulans TaxID=1710 RepID=UPI00381632DA
MAKDEAPKTFKILGVGLLALVAGILLLNWLGGQGVQGTELDVDRNGNLIEVDD